jgi:ribulose-5-phosphate 4-epimerase/fuculose-1-phosphate aldolase
MNELQKKYESAIEELAATSRRTGELGYATSFGGNLSCKVADDTILITPTTFSKRLIRFEDIIIINGNGDVLFAEPGKRPSGETPMHTRLYELRPDITSVVHAHPPVLTGFSMTDSDILSRPLLPEAVIEVGPVLPVDYAQPITEALAAKFEKVVDKTNVWLMKSHGATIAGRDGVARTLDLLEMIEAMAISVQAAMVVGKINEISREEVGNLENTMRDRGIPCLGDPRVVSKLTDLY